MPKLSSGRHTAASIRETAENLKEIVKQIENVAIAFESSKGIEAVTIEQEAAREDGVAFLQQWADRARNALRTARLEQAKGGVSDKSGTSPNASGGTQKTKRR